jgi:hypothetical protein
MNQGVEQQYQLVLVFNFSTDLTKMLTENPPNNAGSGMADSTHNEVFTSFMLAELSYLRAVKQAE